MLHDTPLRKRHEEFARSDAERGTDPSIASARPGAATGRAEGGPGVEYVTYGPPDDEGLVTCEVPATFGPVEAEYAALRRGAGILDAPHRGTLVLTGGDRRALLDSMLTQSLATLSPGAAAESFWLNRKGRIEADLLLVETADRTLVDVDVHQAAATAEGIDRFVFAEDVEVSDASPSFHRLAVHGPRAADVVAAAAGTSLALDALASAEIEIAGVPVVVARRDQVGACGLELFLPYDGAAAVWDALLAGDEGETGGAPRRVRPVGWYAWNVARIEAGTPLFNIDFGPASLPHETGVVDDRVSFTKGCYLGQEIVARMASRGGPKQTLVGLRVRDDKLPVAGGQVFERVDGGMGDQIGVVTSSTLSPMLGQAPVAFAVVRTVAAGPGTTVLVNAEGAQAEATVGPLRFWSPGEEDVA